MRLPGYGSARVAKYSLLCILINEASRIERSYFLNAQPHESTAERTDYADGFKLKTMITRLGLLTFLVPQVCGGGFYPRVLAHQDGRTKPVYGWASPH